MLVIMNIAISQYWRGAIDPKETGIDFLKLHVESTVVVECGAAIDHCGNQMQEPWWAALRDGLGWRDGATAAKLHNQRSWLSSFVNLTRHGSYISHRSRESLLAIQSVNFDDDCTNTAK